MQNSLIEDKNFLTIFTGLGASIKGVLLSIVVKIKNFFITFIHRLVHGNFATKISHIIMGFGNFYHKQIIKGFIYLILQAGFILFMIMCPRINDTPFGYKALINFRTLGTEHGDIFTKADNSMLMLLFGVVTMGMIALFFFLYLSNLKSAYKAECDTRTKGRATSFIEDIKDLLDNKFYVTMLIPTFVGVSIFTIMPIIFTIFIAFTNFDSNHQGEVLFTWVGLDNIAGLFTRTGEIGQRFIPVFTWTVTWTFFATFSCYFGGMFLAILINMKGVRFKVFFRTIFVLTIAMPQFISLLAVRSLLSELGPFNSMLMNLGITNEPISFLQHSESILRARATIIIANFWLGVPYTMIMTTGILMNIPGELYDAAKIDGASPFKILQKITLPFVVFVTTPFLITSFLGNFNNFNVIFLLSGGLPRASGGYWAGHTDLLVTWLYRLSVDQREFNLGAVIGIITFLCTTTIALFTYRRTKAYKEEDRFQ